jgi:hypothetical protein
LSIQTTRSRIDGDEGTLITVDVNPGNYLTVIENMLGNLRGQAPSTLCNAVNAVAKEMKNRMVEQARETYDTKAILKKEVKIRRASGSNYTAKLQSRGERLGMAKFKVSPGRLAHGRRRPKQYKAKILKSSEMQVMKYGGLKAFLVQFSSGHKALVERDPSKRYGERGADGRIAKYGRHADMAAIVEKKGPSVAEMLGSRKVYGALEPEMGDRLREEVLRQINRTIAREAARRR